MKTKVVVSGGLAEEPNELNSLFFKEILDGTGDEVTVLLILFSRPEAVWDMKSKGAIAQFDKVRGGKKVSYIIANHNKLEEQIGMSDVIYIRGGTTLLLMDGIAEHPKFVELIKAKIVAAESAGTYLLSDYFYSKSEGGIFKGLGVLPVKTICHFEGKNEEQLNKCPQGLEKLLLKSFEHKVYLI
jgi:hypothetical protein